MLAVKAVGTALVAAAQIHPAKGEEQTEDMAAREAAAQEAAAKEAAAKEAASKQTVAKEATSKQVAAKEAAAKGSATREAAGREEASKEAMTREAATKESEAVARTGRKVAVTDERHMSAWKMITAASPVGVGVRALPERASIAEPQQALLNALCTRAAEAPPAPALPSTGPCDKCDGPHATDSCPHFQGKRDDHKDAWDSCAWHSSNSTCPYLLAVAPSHAALDRSRSLNRLGRGACQGTRRGSIHIARN
mmetsp:Transcript_35827/g.94118  ORF Transcript_35827/g.94118 Transcript_35827/m.94118 type:complete len:251 (-) Transcript_35827:791-1543(-)